MRKPVSTVVPDILSQKLEPKRASSWKICRARQGRPANPRGTKSLQNCSGTSREAWIWSFDRSSSSGLSQRQNKNYRLLFKDKRCSQTQRGRHYTGWRSVNETRCPTHHICRTSPHPIIIDSGPQNPKVQEKSVYMYECNQFLRTRSASNEESYWD